MKRICLLILSLAVFCSCLLAQSDTIGQIIFTYDNAGNRIEREVVYYESSKKSAEIVDIEKETEDPDRDLKVYPNPASNSLYVILNAEAMEEGQRMLILFDNLGKQLFQITAGQEVNRIDVSSLTNGTYILRLIYGKKQKEWIIIKN
jgi:uncharacterized protein (DUF2249 family)